MTMITENRAMSRPLAAPSFLASVARLFTTYRRNRRVVVELTAMDDHILRDIGLSRAEVNQASVADLSTDRIAMLNRARARRIV